MKRFVSSFFNRVFSHVWPPIEKWILKEGYNPHRYWTLRGHFFHLEQYQRALHWQHPWIVDQLNTLTWHRLLEIGCGFGRNLQYLRKHFPSKDLIGIDFSRPLLRQAQRRLAGHNIQLCEGSVLSLPAISNCIDVVLTMGLLMHIPPEDMTKAVLHLSCLNAEYFLCVEQNSSGLSRERKETIRINAFTFSHDYEDLFRNIGMQLVRKETNANLTAYVFKKAGFDQ